MSIELTCEIPAEAKALSMTVGNQYKFAILNVVDERLVIEETSDDENYENFAKKLINSKSVFTKLGKSLEYPGSRYGLYNFKYYDHDEIPRNGNLLIVWMPSASNDMGKIKMQYTGTKKRVEEALKPKVTVELHDNEDLFDTMTLVKKLNKDAVRLRED